MVRWKFVAIAGVASLALAGCSAAGTSAPQAADTDLVLGANLAPTTLDPAGASWGAVSPFFQAAYDTLLLLSSDGEIEPFLATDWEYNEDNTVLTLTLRDDVVFTDGTDLTSADVVASLERYRTGTSPNAATLSNVDTIEAPDDTTVVITLSAPDPALLNYLTRDAGLVGSEDAVDSGVDLSTTTVGSGPYILDTEATVTGTSYVYDRNDDYWNPDLQHYDTVTINVITDATASLNTILAGEADAVRLTTNDNSDRIEAAGWTLNRQETDVFGLLLFDRAGEMSEPLADVRVRQAINYAVDREAMLETLQKGYGSVTTQIFPTNSAAYDEELDEAYPFDPDKARELMAEAGYSDGFTLAMPSTTLLPPATYSLISQQLADIGITAEYTDPGNNLIADIFGGKFPAAYFGMEQTPDWQLIQFAVSPSAVFNPLGYEDPTVEGLISDIQTGDLEEQTSAAAELNDYLVEQAWFAPFYRISGAVATAPQTTVELNAVNLFPNIYDFQPAD